MKEDLKISVINFTYRMGGIDMLVDCLKQQDYKNWELLMVDDYPGRNVEDYLTENDIPVGFYGKSKKQCYPDTPFKQCNAWNTALQHATGDIVISFIDYQWMPKWSLSRWNEIYQDKMDTLIAACYLELGYSGEMVKGDISAFDPPFEGWDMEMFHDRFYHDISINPPKGWVVPRIYIGPPEMGAGPWEFFYSAAPMEFWDKVNGADERGDYAHAYLHLVPQWQAFLHGYKFLVDEKNWCYAVRHHDWDFIDPKMWYYTRTGKDTIDWNTYKWSMRSPNCFNLKEERLKNAN